MRGSTVAPGTTARMSPGIAIGIIAGAIRAGLSADEIDRTIDIAFTSDAAFLKRILAKFEGNDWTIDLWHLQPNGRYKLATDLCRPGEVAWRRLRAAA